MAGDYSNETILTRIDIIEKTIFFLIPAFAGMRQQGTAWLFSDRLEKGKQFGVPSGHHFVKDLTEPEHVVIK